ncbi:MAG: QueT transporter family protein [Eubacteriales bacterium]|nr:QueT transporter family protein [Eubacteriales bacterium]MDD3882827.1 QueT transporter family protein [Eubacteriales bacterium]MDD4513275.1 QueT transporter family protein [Eubacteriales bacterium]
MKTENLRALTFGALIAAVYAVLTYALAPISYGAVQFRVSEALTMLPMLMPCAVPGLFVGCIIANLIGGAGLVDVIVGSLATLAAAILTRMLRKKPLIALLMPVILNGVMVGASLSYIYNLPLFETMGTVALGEAVVLYALGYPLYLALSRSPALKKYFTR